MTAGGDLLYRCRLCGAVHRPAHAPHSLLAVVYGICDETPADWGSSVKMLHVHACADGVTGVSDFIGSIEDGHDFDLHAKVSK